MLYFLGLKLPHDLKEEVKKLHGVLGVGSHSTAPPHITLVPSFDLETDEDFLIDDLEDVFENIHQFDIEIKGLGSFANSKDHNAVYFDVIDSPQLEDLRDSLCDILKAKVRNSDLVRNSDFHITISKGLTTEELDYAIKKLKDYYREQTFTAYKIYLFRVQDDEPWEEYKIFDLKEK